MTIEVTDYQLKKLANLTRKCIFDDKMFEEAGTRTRIKYL